MNPKLYEGLAVQHVADLHREATGSRMVACADGGDQEDALGRRHRVRGGFESLAALIGALRIRIRIRARRASA